MAANEGMKDLLVLVINESSSLSLATSHSTRSVGFNISSRVSVSMVTLQFCMHSTALQKNEDIHNVHLAPVVERTTTYTPNQTKGPSRPTPISGNGKQLVPREKSRNMARVLWQIPRIIPGSSK